MKDLAIIDKRFIVDLGHRKRLVEVLIYSYLFIIPFGNLLRLNFTATSLGLSSIVLVSILVLSLPDILKNFYKDKICILFLILLGYSLLSGLSNIFYADYEQLIIAYKHQMSLITYFLFMVSVSIIDWTSSRLLKAGLVTLFSLFIAGLITLIDLAGVIDIPRVNVPLYATWIGSVPIMQYFGAFAHRTSLSIYLSTLITFIILLRETNIATENFRKFSIIVAGISFVLVLLSHNRAAPIAIICTTGLFLALWKKNIKVILRLVFFFVLTMMTTFLLSPKVLPAYLYNFNCPEFAKNVLSFLGAESPELTELTSEMVMASDMIRLEIFKAVLAAIKINPIGAGFAQVYTERFGYYEPHSVIIYIIFALGYFGIVWLGIFFWIVLKEFVDIKKNCWPKEFRWPICGALTAWFLIGIMHNSLFTGITWMFLGMMISLYRKAKEFDKVN